MRSEIASSLALLPALAWAVVQSDAPTVLPAEGTMTIMDESSKTTIPAGETQTIKVGDGDDSFKPDTIYAAVGAIIKYDFVGDGEFSVASGPFDRPCTSHEEGQGFYSGAFSSGDVDGQGDDENTSFQFKVEKTSPIWYFGASRLHCKNGMVGVINPPTGEDANTLEQYKEKAAQSNGTVIVDDSVHGGKPTPGDGTYDPKPADKQNNDDEENNDEDEDEDEDEDSTTTHIVHSDGPSGTGDNVMPSDTNEPSAGIIVQSHVGLVWATLLVAVAAGAFGLL